MPAATPVTISDLATRLAIWMDKNDEDAFPSTQREFCINAARTEIGRLHLRWQEAVTVVAPSVGGYYLACPARWDGTRGLKRQNGKSADAFYYSSALRQLRYLAWISYPKYVELYPDPAGDATLRGEPSYWTEEAGTIYYTPSAAGTAFTLLHWTLPLNLSLGDSDDFLVAAEHAIFWNAMGKAQLFFPGEEARYPQWDSFYREALLQLVSSVERARVASQEMTKDQAGAPGR